MPVTYTEETVQVVFTLGSTKIQEQSTELVGYKGAAAGELISVAESSKEAVHSNVFEGIEHRC